MTVEELLKPYGALLDNPDINKKMTELAVNCISLVDTWLNGKEVKSLKLDKCDSNGDLIKTLYGLNADNIYWEIFKICFEKPKDVSVIKLYELKKVDMHIQDIQIGVLDIV